MSEYFFLPGCGHIPARMAKAIDKIARDYGASFCSQTMPGDGPRYWFVGPNRGEPFDSDLENEVFHALRRAGHMDDDGKIKVWQKGRTKTKLDESVDHIMWIIGDKSYRCDVLPGHCPKCMIRAIVSLPPPLLAEQPDATTHVCHSSYGGCNLGYELVLRKTRAS